MCRPRGGQIPIERRGRYADAVGNVGDWNIGIGEQRPRNVEVVLGQLRRSAACPPHALRGLKPRAGAFPNEPPLKLRQGAEHVKHQHALRGRRVDSLGEAAKADAAQSQFLDGLDELLHRPRQPVEFPNNENVAAAGVVKRLAQRGTIFVQSDNYGGRLSTIKLAKSGERRVARRKLRA